ncbi:hypothetical protein MSG28_014688 [Choristoneura fumiferana]|uniref:Uncharacterized protein n=1 Tax=Choristoneura fumiferana TaxID=7141 RepID=A0ACC0JS98_CHOFU|nr:hypothetical protein MSG28_014688 [Choristoneura fumiferana]
MAGIEIAMRYLAAHTTRLLWRRVGKRHASYLPVAREPLLVAGGGAVHAREEGGRGAARGPRLTPHASRRRAASYLPVAREPLLVAGGGAVHAREEGGRGAARGPRLTPHPAGQPHTSRGARATAGSRRRRGACARGRRARRGPWPTPHASRGRAASYLPVAREPLLVAGGGAVHAREEGGRGAARGPRLTPHAAGQPHTSPWRASHCW